MLQSIQVPTGSLDVRSPFGQEQLYVAARPVARPLLHEIRCTDVAIEAVVHTVPTIVPCADLPSPAVAAPTAAARGFRIILGGATARGRWQREPRGRLPGRHPRAAGRRGASRTTGLARGTGRRSARAPRARTRQRPAAGSGPSRRPRSGRFMVAGACHTTRTTKRPKEPRLVASAAC